MYQSFFSLCFCFLDLLWVLCAVIVVSFQQLDIQGFGAAGAKSVHAMGCINSREAADQGDIRNTIQVGD
jgi:hypothetical protein